MIKINKIYPSRNVRYVTWLLNNVCPYSCVYCPEIVHSGTIKSYFNLEIYEEFLDYLFDHWNGSTIIFAFSGGEPTVHPHFEQILNKIYKAGHSFGLTSNLSKNIKFWERIRTKLEYVSASFHPEYVNTKEKQDKFIDKLNLIAEKAGCEIRVMMYPDLWEECIEFINKLEKSFVGDDVIPVIVLEDFGVNEKYVDITYTDDQLKWIKEFVHDPDAVRSDGLQIIDDNIKHQGYFEDNFGKKHLMRNVQQISNDKITNFNGWSCNIGIDSIYLNWDGIIRGGNCLEGGYIGDIISKVNWNSEPIICGSTYCHCVTDIKVSKEFNDNSNEVFVPEYHILKPSPDIRINDIIYNLTKTSGYIIGQSNVYNAKDWKMILAIDSDISNVIGNEQDDPDGNYWGQEHGKESFPHLKGKSIYYQDYLYWKDEKNWHTQINDNGVTILDWGEHPKLDSNIDLQIKKIKWVVGNDMEYTSNLLTLKKDTIYYIRPGLCNLKKNEYLWSVRSYIGNYSTIPYTLVGKINVNN
jgi:MoaA/NifB/PqqE/SkfB family radical SAM enzyme